MTTHATLKADIATYLARDDLSSIIPTLITLCESDIQADVRCRAMETAADLTLTGQSVSVPSGFLGVRSLYYDDATYRPLTFVPSDEFWESQYSALAGIPAWYTIQGDTIYIGPYVTSGTAKLNYSKAFDALSADADTNWLLTNHYGVYLYGALQHAKAYIEDDEQAAKWGQFYGQAVARVNQEAKRSRYSQSLTRRSSCP